MPQWVSLRAMSTHAPAQGLSRLTQPQRPLVQKAPAAQRTPQPPQ
jgi:hypothetical protein